MKNKVKRKYQHIIMLAIACFIVFFSILFGGTQKDTSSAYMERDKSIKSILICQGDTLWSIAKANHTDLNGELKDYVNEIRRVNRLDSDIIRSGNYLLVPFFKET